jgi:hypothetical protein
MSNTILARKAAIAGTALLAALGLAAVFGTDAFASATTTQSSSSDRGGSDDAPAHVFVIMMENHGFSQVVGNTADAPYITSLAQRYNVATNYHGVTHPSLPNYLAAISGDFQGIWDDCKAGAGVTCAPEEFVPDSGDATAGASLTPAQVASASSAAHMFNGRNIADQLEARGLSWKAYLQSMPSTGFQGEYAPVINGTTVKLYAQKHNPFMYFSDINSPNNPRLNNVVPFEQNFDADLASGHLANFVWISPDQCHDMHGVSPSTAALVGLPSCGYPDAGLDHGAIKLGDDYVHETVTRIMNSRTWKTTRSSIVLAWDENDYSGFSGGPGSPVGANGTVLGGGDAPLIVINSAGGPHKTTDKLADHYTLLSTIEHMWHLGCLANTCSPLSSGSLENLFAN